MTDHAPLPWMVSGGCIAADVPNLIGNIICESPCGLDASLAHWPANADFIVHACNAHPDLVAALRTYGEHRSDCPAFFDAKDTCDCGLSAALAKAEGRT